MALRQISKKGIRVPSVSISRPLKHGRSSIFAITEIARKPISTSAKNIPEALLELRSGVSYRLRLLETMISWYYLHDNSLSALSYKGLVVVEYWQKNPLYGGFMQVQNCWQGEEMRSQLD
ncbi:hypothetical protein Dsin_019835 [Dipteronia sinensis]|uniref:Uncharacterized protein n=1 Tax=Dipteronia sinensis TaxID=43782 RepID=A0AAE0A8W8_9ROSI|nr:hypothetical protein Dsin_019835 [Dipteronia sinensis]